MMERGCVAFRCLRRRGYFCCADCGERGICRRPCLNSPEICGLSRENAPGEREDKEYAREADR